jgi:hypothetical protein
MFFPARGSVPANLSEILFWPAAQRDDDAGAPGAAEVRFVRVEPSGPVDVPFDLAPSDHVSGRRWSRRDPPGYRIIPRAPLQVGSRYALWAKDCDGVMAATPPSAPDTPLDEDWTKMPQARFAVFDAAAEAPLPASLGAVALSTTKRELLQLDDSSGACAGMYEVASVDAMSSARLGPWASAIAFSTFIDGVPYSPSDSLNFSAAFGHSWVGQGRDKAVVVCSGPASWMEILSPGKHTLQFRGTIPGTTVALSSETVEFELPHCGPIDHEGGAPPTGTGGWPSGPPLAPSGTGGKPSAPPVTPSEQPDAGSVDTSSGPPRAATAVSESSCSMGLRESGAGGWSGGAVVLTALGLTRLRRRSIATSRGELQR